MSFAELRLYSYGLDRSRGDVPIFATAAAEAAAGAGTGVTAASLSFSNVKVRRDPYPQTVEVSIDASNIGTLELCDTAVMKIGSVDRWYWITGYEEITNSSYPNSSVNRMNVRISLEYIPVTTGLSLASTVDLIPERMPSATPRVMQNWTQSIMKRATPGTALPAFPKLPTLRNSGTAVPVLWCEIVYTDTTGVHKRGIFVQTQIITPVLPNDSRVFCGYSGPDDDYWNYYPALMDVINDPDTYLGLSSATVTDITVSEFCPYQIIKNATWSGHSGFDYIRLKALDGSEITPTLRYTRTISASTHYYYYDYDLDSFMLPFYGTAAGYLSTYPAFNKGTMSITLTSFEKLNGVISIKDTMFNTVMTIPRELNETSMSFSYYVYSDTSNIYIVLTYENIQITLPGYKIPWITTMWDQYRAYNLQYDRQALQNNIDAANREMNNAMVDAAATGLIGGAVTGAITGGPAGAALGAGVGVGSLISSFASADMKRNETIRKLTQDQKLTEQRMRGGPATMNNIAYGSGIIEVINNQNGAQFILEMPSDFTETEFNAQTAIWGYPSNKVKQDTVALTAGYWKGRILNFTNTINNTSTGELSNLMVEQFDNGIRLKQVS